MFIQQRFTSSLEVFTTSPSLTNSCPDPLAHSVGSYQYTQGFQLFSENHAQAVVISHSLLAVIHTRGLPSITLRVQNARFACLSKAYLSLRGTTATISIAPISSDDTAIWKNTETRKPRYPSDFLTNINIPSPQTALLFPATLPDGFITARSSKFRA